MANTIKKRLDDWAEFLDTSSNKNFMYVIGVRTDSPRPLPYPENFESRIEWAAAAYERQMERAQWLDDDYVPCVMAYTGTEIVAHAFGSPVHYPKDDMPFALPAFRDKSGLRGLKKPDLFSSNMGMIFEIARRIQDKVGKDAMVLLPDVQSPLDSASLIWEKADFLASLIEEPEAVLELIAMVEEFLTEFLDEWFKEFGTEYIAHCPYFPMRGGFSFSEDEVGEFSAAMFEKFSLPSLNRMSKRYGGCAMHCCAHATHQWDSFRRIEGLRLLNICQPYEKIEKTAKFFGSDYCHMPHLAMDGREQPRPIPDWAKAFGKDLHLALGVGAENENEARSFASRLREYAHERAEA